MKTDCDKCKHPLSEHKPNIAYDRLFCEHYIGSKSQSSCNCVLGQVEDNEFKISISTWPGLGNYILYGKETAAMVEQYKKQMEKSLMEDLFKAYDEDKHKRKEFLNDMGLDSSGNEK